MSAAELAEALERAVPGAVVAHADGIDMPTLTVAREHLLAACRELRDAHGRNFLSAVSAVATTLGARTELIRRQRELIEKHHRRMVVDGRDITTVVAPGAEVRMLLTASEEARLRRRGIQLGGTQNAEQLAAQVIHRDAKDSMVVNFTQAADGVVTLDSSDLDFEETVDAALVIVTKVLNRD